MTRTRLILAAFFAHALAGGSIFTRIPDIQSGLGLSESVLGMALTFAAVGSLTSNLVAGRVVGAVGTKPILVWVTPVIAVFAALAAFAPTLPLLILMVMFNGIAFSLVNVAMNVEADRVEAETGQRVMNRCHGVWSAGMLIAATTGVGARAVPISAGVHLAAFVPFVAAISFLVLSRMEPSPRAPGDRAGRKGIALPSRRTILLMLFGLSGGVSQIGTQNFSVIFMRDTFAAPAWVDTLSLPAFLVTMMLGRMFADGWITRLGPSRVAFALTLAAIAGAVLVAAAPGPVVALAGFALVGIGISTLFPLMVSAAARSGSRPPAESVSAVILATGVVMLFLPAVQGWIAEIWGVRAAFGMMIVPMLVTLSLCGLADARRAEAPEPAS